MYTSIKKNKKLETAFMARKFYKNILEVKGKNMQELQEKSMEFKTIKK